MSRWLALLLAACGGNPAVPNVSDPTCGLVEIDAYSTDADTCIRLSDKNGTTRFRFAESTECGGPDCLFVGPNESAVVLTKPDLGPEPEWRVEVERCELVPQCPFTGP